MRAKWKDTPKRKKLIESIKPISKGPDTVLFGADVNFGVGFDIGLGITTIASKNTPLRFLATVGSEGQWRSVT